MRFALLCLSLAACAQDAATFRGGPARTGVFQAPGAPKFSRVKWAFKTGYRVIASPVAANGLVYAGSMDHKMYALDGGTGEKKWDFTSGGPITSTATVANGAVYFTSFDGKAYALDAATGKARWEFSTGGERRFAHTALHGVGPDAEAHPDSWDLWLSSPAVAGGLMFFGSGDHNVYALDAVTGALKWKFATGDVVHASPTVVNGIVYIGSWDASFYALDAESGRLKWRFQTGVDPQTGNQQGIHGAAAVADGIVYFGCRDAHVYAVDAATGARRWEYATAGSWVESSPAVSDGMVYAGTSDSAMLFAFEAQTGKLAWQRGMTNFVFSSPAVANGMLYAGTFDGKLHALDLKTHETAWVFQTAASKENLPKLTRADGKFDFTRLFHCNFWDEMVVAVDRLFSTGSIIASPFVEGTTVYVASTDGSIYALE